MAVTRITKTISFTPEEQASLTFICEDTGMKESEVIRELIFKAEKDKETRKIITSNNFWTKQEERSKRQIGRTSHNVQHDETKKDASPMRDAGNVVRVPTTSLTPEEEETIRLVKAEGGQWVRDILESF